MRKRIICILFLCFLLFSAIGEGVVMGNPMEQPKGEQPFIAATPSPTPEPYGTEEDAGTGSVTYVHGIGVYDTGEGIFCEDWAKDAVYPRTGMRIPQLYQYNFVSPLARVGGRDRSVKTSGCGATSLSMIAAYLTGNLRQSPYTLFRFACNGGMYHGSGLSHDAMDAIAELLHIDGEWIARDKDAVIEALREGKPIIAHMGYGIFTRRGHYIVLRGLTEDGLVLVNDPNSFVNTHTAFPIETIIAQSRSATPFKICKRKTQW
ncbi:MAG: C39 family peptidase [Christensenellales bacterium]